jgi:hypothetical protein
MVKKPKRKMGRPATGVGKPITVRLQPDALRVLDKWRKRQPDLPTRPEAIRQIIGILDPPNFYDLEYKIRDIIADV